MKTCFPIFIFLAVISSVVSFSPSLQAQCLSYPLPFEQRVAASSMIVQGKVTEQSCYMDLDGNIYTLNLVTVQAYLKGHSDMTEVGVITQGGVLGDKAQINMPAVQLMLNEEYMLFLDRDNDQVDNKSVRSGRPGLVQAMTYGDAQGALLYQFGKYADIHYRTKDDEATMVERISLLTGESARTPLGTHFKPRIFVPSVDMRTQPITNFSPSPTPGGTIVPGDFLNITGSGFGAGAGAVFYTNADDGGATFTASGVASDNVSWADGAITNKVARRAGTGPINVNGVMTSGSNLTVPYSHLDINSTFSGFGSTTRQRYYLRNLNGLGGYTFLYNTTSGFDADEPAKAAFERALLTWRCQTFVNFSADGNTAQGNALDGTSAILYDNTLSAGTYMQLINRFSGSASVSCTLANTVWWVSEMDIRVAPIPAPGFPWEYGPALPDPSEFDMESHFLHELGHGLGLGHVISPGDVMHFAFASGESVRTLNANNILGGTVKMAYCTVPTCFNPSFGGTEMIALTGSNCDPSLPLELLHFTGQWEGETVALEWATAFEEKVARFEVERAPDGVHFERIATVAATGNSNEEQRYHCDDLSPLKGLNYYRLKSCDVDGTFEYSDMISLSSPQETPPFQVAPNPAVQTIRLTIHQPGQYLLINESGQIVKSLSLSAGQHEITTGILPSGNYFITDPAMQYRLKVVLINEF